MADEPAAGDHSTRTGGFLSERYRELRDFVAANVLVAQSFRHDPRRLVKQVILTWIVDAVAIVLAAWAIGPIQVADLTSLVLAVVLISAANALIRPIVVRFLIRFAVLTFGVLTVVINGLMIALVAQILPGFAVGSFLGAVALTIWLAVVNLALGWALDLDWAESFYRQVVLEQLRRRYTDSTPDGPGVVFVQVDGLSEALLRFAIRTGSAPNLGRWVRSGTHRLVGWETLLPSQTSASQAGILFGRNDDIPAFRWYDKETGHLFVSNKPADAASLEHRLSDGTGLLAHGGTSVSNLLSGDATQSILTNSTLLGRGGLRSRDFWGFYSDPSSFFRMVALVIIELIREANESRRQRLRGIEPRIGRGWPYPLLRAVSCVVLRDLSVAVVLEDMYRGVPAIYVDLVGYDEVAHHAGPERPEALDELSEMDRQIGLLARAAEHAARPYEFVVLSDHGQSQGATFRQRWGVSLDHLLTRWMHGDDAISASATNSESWGRVGIVVAELSQSDGRLAKAAKRSLPKAPADPVSSTDRTAVVCVSGNLAGVYFPAIPGRATRETLEAVYPGVVRALCEHPGIGAVLVRTADGPVVLGKLGHRRLRDDRVDGEDPLASFGSHAADAFRRLDGFANCGDLMVVSAVDADTGEVAAFEELVGSHGGLGGVQTDAFLLYPTSFRDPALPLVGAPAIHDVLTGWLDDLGLRSDPAPAAAAAAADVVIPRSEPAETTAAASGSA